MTPQKALTVGVIAERLGVPVHRIEYLLTSREIKPVQRAGRLRVFDEAALRVLKGELATGGRKDRIQCQ